MKPKLVGASSRVAGGRNLHLAGSLITSYLKRSNHKASMSSRATGRGGHSGGSKCFAYVCSGCDKPIRRDKYLLKACDKYWHENCLKCDRCNGRLGELGSTLYCKSNMNLCRQDYLELFGETGVCSVCEKVICASEMVMRARKNVYHLECFACQLCNQRFCVGDRFYLCENKVVCQYDYEEHILPIQRSLEQEQEQVACAPPNEPFIEQAQYQLNSPGPVHLNTELIGPTTTQDSSSLTLTTLTDNKISQPDGDASNAAELIVPSTIANLEVEATSAADTSMASIAGIETEEQTSVD